MRPRTSPIRRLLDRSGSRRREGTEPVAEDPAEAETGLPSEPEPEPDPKPEPVPGVVALALRDATPRAWNLWELERLAAGLDADAQAEERALLLLHLREFADPAGNLPLEFDLLVRDAFGAGLAEHVT